MPRLRNQSTVTARDLDAPDTAPVIPRRPKWMQHGSCAKVGPDDPLWYPTGGSTATPAIRVCNDCPVKSECLNHAITHQEAHGVWGGTSPATRLRLTTRINRMAAPQQQGAEVAQLIASGTHDQSDAIAHVSETSGQSTIAVTIAYRRWLHRSTQ